ncbi:MAG TPA: serine/threonine-protein kinase [Candidatus Anammoximicrobium sp.]|nr:serine/threonine-protein kinase [Candidatus Anammoximicrobium sp.]
MLTTTHHDIHATMTRGRPDGPDADAELVARYQSLLKSKYFPWTVHHHFTRRLGAGGQGVVYLTEHRGADGFTVPVAVKMFAPERYEDARAYDEAMQRIAHVSALVARIQQDNLLTVLNFVDHDRIRVMLMEWVDGYDIRRLLGKETLARVKGRVSVRRWDYINNVIATAGPEQTRFKPGVAVAIVKECLMALASLHREGIVHGDIKPSNVMLKRTGNAKIIDIGSAFELEKPPPIRTCTPSYAAPEVLDGGDMTPRSDLASLGYVLVEMLSGCQPFAGLKTYRELLEAKRMLPQRLPWILPGEVTCNELLMSFCRNLIAPDPQMRFQSAESANLVKDGASAFLRQLVKGDMSSEYENEIRLLIEELKEMSEITEEEPRSTH